MPRGATGKRCDQSWCLPQVSAVLGNMRKTDGGAEGEIFGGQTLFFLLIVFCANPGGNDRKARTTSSKYKLARPKSEACVSPFLIRDNMRWRVDSSLVVLTIRQSC